MSRQIVLSGPVAAAARAKLLAAARDAAPVTGLTHGYYKYPARFSPSVARTAIELFTAPGELVLDPFMGGGTSVVEAISLGRRVVGNDVNSLAVYIARVKTTALSKRARGEISAWVEAVGEHLSYRTVSPRVSASRADRRAKNLGIPRARAIKKLIALAMDSSNSLSCISARSFARAIVLNVGQWALNGRREPVTASAFRARLRDVGSEMLEASLPLPPTESDPSAAQCVLYLGAAAHLPRKPCFRAGAKADLVVTSPPYPGIHVLYHRWQVDGRRESPAPYWIVDRTDGRGNAFYNFADRRDLTYDKYFAALRLNMEAVRSVLRPGGTIVQVVALPSNEGLLGRFLRVMSEVGFSEIRFMGSRGTLHHRIRRRVPGRRWYTAHRGSAAGAVEVVLLHKAI